jgi:hypothetical protein
MALTGMGVVASLISIVIFIFVNALLLMAATKIFKLKDSSYKTALWVTAILGGVSFLIGLLIGLLPTLAGIIGTLLTWVVVGVLLAMYLIKVKYELEWNKAALTWLVYFVFALVAKLIVGAILGIIFLAIGLGALAA